MPRNLPTNEEIRDRLRETMHPLILRNPGLAADVIPMTLAKAVEIACAFRAEIERLEACADPELLDAVRKAQQLAFQVWDQCDALDYLEIDGERVNINDLIIWFDLVFERGAGGHRCR